MNAAIRGAPLSAEEELRASAELLATVNRASGTRDLLTKILAFMRSLSGCEAVGIRIKQGDDYPYYVTEGFPDDFVRTETSLCARDLAGQLLRDEIGDPVLECMCGNVICGRFDPSKSFFTESGGFWTNSVAGLLAASTEIHVRGRRRNRCSSAGYESVALIPLKLGSARLGLIQLDDERPDAFCVQRIALYERLADHVSRALAQTLAMEGLKESEERYQSIIRASMDGFRVADSEGRILDVNEAYCRMSGYSREALLGMRIGDLDVAEDPAGTAALHLSRIRAEGYERYEARHRRADGSVCDVEVSSYFEPGRGRSLAFVRDITGRKEDYARIETLLKEKELLLKEVQHRVKNNLSTMQSLLSIQASNARDGTAAAVLADAQARLGSMSLLYEKLYRRDEAGGLSLDEYLPALVRQIASTFPAAPSVRIETEAEDLVLPVKTLSTLGILVNELITNAMKHAFPGRARGRLRVSASSREGRVIVVVEDDGRGMPEEGRSHEGLGLKLAGLLAEQLEASLSIESAEGRGTKVVLDFARPA